MTRRTGRGRARGQAQVHRSRSDRAEAAGTERARQKAQPPRGGGEPAEVAGSNPHRWLIKSEPEVYSIDDLARDGQTGWEGVRNYQARNLMRDSMRPGELALYYHSNADPSGVAGLARIVRAGVPDPSQFDKRSEYYDPASTRAAPRWQMIEVQFVERFKAVVPLERLKAEKALAQMPLLQKGSRLSVQPVSEEQFERVLKLAR